MNLTVRLLGTEVLNISTEPSDPKPELSPGTVASQVEFGFNNTRAVDIECVEERV